MTQPVKAGWMQRQTEIFRRWKRQYCVLYMDGGFSYFSDQSRSNSEGSLHLPTNLNFIKVGTEVLNTDAPTDRTMSCLLELQTSKGAIVFCADSPDDSEAWKTAMVEVKNMNVRARTNPPSQFAPAPQQPPPYPQSGVQPPPPPPPQVPPSAQNPNPPVYSPGQPQMYPQPYPPAYQQGTPPQAPPPCYAPAQQVVHTTVYRNGRRGYPRQTTVYSYPGQTCYGVGGNTTVYSTNGRTTTVYPTNPNQQGQTTVVVHENRNQVDAATGFVAGAAVGSMMMAPLLFW